MKYPQLIKYPIEKKCFKKFKNLLRKKVLFMLLKINFVKFTSSFDQFTIIFMKL